MHLFSIVSKPNIDWHTFLKVTFEGTGKRLAEYADSSNRPFTEDQKLASCLSALIGQDPGTMQPMVQTHLQFCGLLVCDEMDLIDVLQATGKLAYCGAPATKRGVAIAFLSGPLGEWRDAVISGLRQPTTQPIFESIYHAFLSVGYSTVWDGYRAVTPVGGRLLLEAKR